MAFLLSVATPGPDVLVVIGRALADGRALRCAGLILGIVAGKLLLLTSALVGLIALAKVAGPLFLVVKLAGGAYLIYLGVRLWFGETGEAPIEPARGSFARDLAVGLAMALGNPLAVLFYAALLPNTIDIHKSSLAGGLTLACIVASLTILAYGGYALAASRIRTLFRTGQARRALDRGSAAAMVGAGLAISVR